MNRLIARGKNENTLFIMLLFITLGIVTIWILRHGFILDSATERWSRVLSVLGAKQFLIENLSLIYPHVPVYILTPFYYLPGLQNGSASPYFVSLLCAAALIFIWAGYLNKMGMSFGKRILLILLIVIHPDFLWVATSGSFLAIGMLLFYFLYRGCLLVITEHDLHAYLILSTSIALMFFVDSSTLYLFIALMPMLVIIAPRQILRDSPVSMYLISSAPFLLAASSWAYLNWIFHGDPWLFVTDPSSGFLGGRMHAADYPWLVHYGGSFFAPFVVAFFYMLISYPVVFYLLISARHHQFHLRASFILVLHLILAVAIATSQFFLTHPVMLLAYMSAGVMAEITLRHFHSQKAFIGMVSFLALGVIGGWFLFVQLPNPAMEHWLGAMKGKQQVVDADGSLAVGYWLGQHRVPTMIDHRSAYKVIVARGDAKGLVLSFSNQFKMALRMRNPGVEQLVVADPRGKAGQRDMLNGRYPHLYQQGMSGYRRVYDNRGWRVYRKNHSG